MPMVPACVALGVPAHRLLSAEIGEEEGGSDLSR